MADSFDPYLKWLGIAPKDQPPNHYRLLGIDLFMDDPDVIESAADQRMAHVRSFQSGKKGALSQKLLNEIATAKVCLLDPQQKAAYDRTLTTQPSAAKTIPKAKPLPTGRSNATAANPRPVIAASPFDALANVSQSDQRVVRRKPQKPAWQNPLLLGIGGVLALLVISGLAYVLVSGSGEKDVARAPDSPPEENLSVQPARPSPAVQPESQSNSTLISPDVPTIPPEPAQFPEQKPEDDIPTNPSVENVGPLPSDSPPANQPEPPSTVVTETASPESIGTEESTPKNRRRSTRFPMRRLQSDNKS